MLSWLLSPRQHDMDTLNHLHTPAQADRFNESAAAIHRVPLCMLSAAEVLKTLGNPTRLYLHGDWPALPHNTDLRASVWEDLLARFCQDTPAVLITSRKNSPALMAFSRLCQRGEIRGGDLPNASAALLDDQMPSLWLESLMGEPGHGPENELTSLLEVICRFCGHPTPMQAAALLKDVSPLLSCCPVPEDGRADPLAVPYSQREALARRLIRLDAEQPHGPTGKSLYRLLRDGRSVSWLCTPSQEFTLKLLCRQCKQLDQDGVPFSLILDDPKGDWWGDFVRELGVPVLCRCADTPGAPFSGSRKAEEVFASLLSCFDAILLGGAGQSAPLWCSYLGSFDRAMISRNHSSGIHTAHHHLGFQAGKATNRSWERRPRLEEDQLRRLLDNNGRAFLACRNGTITLYQ